MGSTFSRYKTPAFVNLTTRPRSLLSCCARISTSGIAAADELDTPLRTMRVVRSLVQELIDAGYTDVDFAALIELEAAGADLELAPDSAPVDDGLADRSPGAVTT